MSREDGDDENQFEDLEFGRDNTPPPACLELPRKSKEGTDEDEFLTDDEIVPTSGVLVGPRASMTMKPIAQAEMTEDQACDQVVCGPKSSMTVQPPAEVAQVHARNCEQGEEVANAEATGCSQVTQDSDSLTDPPGMRPAFIQQASQARPEVEADLEHGQMGPAPGVHASGYPVQVRIVDKPILVFVFSTAGLIALAVGALFVEHI